MIEQSQLSFTPRPLPKTFIWRKEIQWTKAVTAIALWVFIYNKLLNLGSTRFAQKYPVTAIVTGSGVACGSFLLTGFYVLNLELFRKNIPYKSLPQNETAVQAPYHPPYREVPSLVELSSRKIKDRLTTVPRGKDTAFPYNSSELNSLTTEIKERLIGKAPIHDLNILFTLIPGIERLELDLSHCAHLVTDETLELLIKHSPKISIVKLNLTGCSITDRGLEILAPYCRDLCELDLSGCSITFFGLRALAAHCHCLHTITLKCEGATAEGIVPLFDGVIALLKVSPNLKYFSLFPPRAYRYWPAYYLSEKLLTTLIHFCPELETLKGKISADLFIKVLASFKQLKTLEVEIVEEGTTRAALDSFLLGTGTSLQELKIRSSYLRHEDEIVFYSQLIKYLTNHAPQLNSFGSSSVMNSNEVDLRALFKGCPHLKLPFYPPAFESTSKDLAKYKYVGSFLNFSIQNDTNAASEDFIDFFRDYSHFQSLDLNHPNITGSVLDAIATQCQQLKSLELRISQPIGMIETFPQLKKLILCETSELHFFINNLLPSAPNLEDLTLVLSQANLSSFITSLKKTRQYPNVHTLHIDCHNQECTLLPELVKLFPHLETLELVRCEGFSKKILQSTFEGFHSLKNLKIKFAKDSNIFDDELLKTIAENHPAIEKLELYQSSHDQFFNFSDDGFAFLAQRCHQLKKIIIEGSCTTLSDNITAQGVIYLAQGCPALRKVRLPGSNSVEIKAGDIFFLMYPRFVNLSNLSTFGLDREGFNARYNTHAYHPKLRKILYYILP